MIRPKKNQHQQSYDSQIERTRALSGDSSLRVRASVGEGIGNELFSADAESVTKPFILSSTGERNNLSSSGSDGGFLAKSKEGRKFNKSYIAVILNIRD